MKERRMTVEGLKLVDLYTDLFKQSRKEKIIPRKGDAFDIVFPGSMLDNVLSRQGMAKEDLAAARKYAVSSGWLSEKPGDSYSITKGGLNSYNSLAIFTYLSPFWP